MYTSTLAPTIPTKKKTAFIINKGLCCYKVIPFSLKNVNNIYQRIVNKIVKEKIGCTMKVYIDDIITKSVHANDHIRHPKDTFHILRKHQMCLTLEKCAFRFTASEFVGFMV